MGKTKMDPADQLLAEALKAYGIGEEYVFATSHDEDAGLVTIVTNGGSKVSYKSGDKVDKLPEIAVTGINTAKRKVIAGKAKE